MTGISKQQQQQFSEAFQSLLKLSKAISMETFYTVACCDKVGCLFCMFSFWEYLL